MGSNGSIGFSQAGEANKPSPSIWGDCPNTLLNDQGKGYFRHIDFLGAGSGTLAAVLDVTTISFGDGLSIIADSDTVDGVVSLKTGEIGGWLDLQTGATDNDAIGLQSEPFCKLVRNSGKKVWVEAYLEVGAIVTEQGFFFGLTEEVNQSVDVIANNVASLISTDSFLGVEILPADPNGLNFVKQKDGGTKATILADATASTAITAAGGTAASVVGDTPVKVGFRFDGRQTVTFYVNGYKVKSEDLDSTYDQAHNLCLVTALKTGANTVAVSFAADWIRYGYQESA